MVSVRSLSQAQLLVLAISVGVIGLVAYFLISAAVPARAGGNLSTQDLTGSISPSDLANDLLGGGIAVSNISYQGDDSAAGRFSGGTGIIGFESGVILSTGNISDVSGPNQNPNTGTPFSSAGDPQLDQLAGFDTFDAAVLEFDFVPQTSTITFQYVFASEEYNEYVGSEFNDVFAFYVNGTNCARVLTNTASAALQPVSINTINNGYFGEPPTNPNLYINNDPFDPDSTGNTVPDANLLNTEMDGLTVVLNCSANVNAGETNHMKLAIADASDPIYDAVVFIKAGSFTVVTPTPPGSPTPSPTPGEEPGLIQGDNDCDTTDVEDPDVDAVDALVSLQNNAGFNYHQDDDCILIAAALPAGLGPNIFGDMDCDDDVDAVDALQILRYVAGFTPNQDEPCTDLGDQLS